jgi:hypothetical protein
MAVICDRFGLPAGEPESVSIADRRCLLAEKRDLLAPPPVPWGDAQGGSVEPLPERIAPWSVRASCMEFLSRFGWLTRAIGK